MLTAPLSQPKTWFQLVNLKQPYGVTIKSHYIADYMCVWTFESLTSVSFSWKSNVSRTLLDRWMMEKFLILTNHLHHSVCAVLLQRKHQVATSSDTFLPSQPLALTSEASAVQWSHGWVKPWRFVEWSLGFHLYKSIRIIKSVCFQVKLSKLHTFGQGEEHDYVKSNFHSYNFYSRLQGLRVA